MEVIQQNALDDDPSSLQAKPTVHDIFTTKLQCHLKLGNC